MDFIELSKLANNTIFPLLNISAILYSLRLIRRYYNKFGNLATEYAIALPVLMYVGIVYILLLIGIITDPSEWLRGPLAILLAGPGFSAYRLMKTNQAIQNANKILNGG